MTWVLKTGAVGLMAISGWMVSGVGSIVHPPQAPVGLDAHESHASASLLGQFRGSVSAWLWMRTDLYLHNGVEMRPMTEAERAIGIQTHQAHDDGHEQLMDESAIVTVVPAAERDFRGAFGDIERAVSAYKDMRGHDHNDPVQALPLFRLMTWIDPQFVTGWTVGASVLARDRTETGTAKALAYLQEGLTDNPASIEILSEIGALHASRRRDFESALHFLARAITLSARTDAEREALRTAYRWTGLCYRGLGRRAALRASMTQGLKFFPDDLVIARLLNPPPLFLTVEAQGEWLKRVVRSEPQ